MIYMSRRPRKIIVIEEKKNKKMKISKQDKIMLEQNRELLNALVLDKLYAPDRK